MIMVSEGDLAGCADWHSKQSCMLGEASNATHCAVLADIVGVIFLQFVVELLLLFQLALLL